MNTSVVIVDNGASTIKAGCTGALQDQPRLIPNAIVRSKGDRTTYFGHELEKCRDYSSLHFRLPFEKGFLVDWDAQKAVWDGLFSSDVLAVDTAEASLLLTEPYFNLPNIQDVYDQFVFEEYEFQSYFRCSPASVIPYGNLFSNGEPPPECMMVVDSGFSFTHVIPVMNGKIIWNAVKRLDVGGKLLTNQLKELVSFRQWNMMDETYIMNHVKESCCFVSRNFKADLEVCRANPKVNPIVLEYVLPDLTKDRKGRIRHEDDVTAETDQILTMNNERFTIPEILFRPDDIGLPQSGLADTIGSSIQLLPEDLQGMFWSNIGLVGGNVKFAGFSERLMSELRTVAPVEHEINIFECEDPVTAAYHSAVTFVGSPEFAENVVTRAEYLESGSSASRRKFRDWKLDQRDKEIEKINAAPKGKTRRRDEDDDRNPHAKKPARTRSRVNTQSKGRA